jgi:hypothetical protein
MQPDNNKDNKVYDSNSKDLSLLEEADQLAGIRSWTRSFALYIIFCQAMSVGDKIRAEACMNLSQKEGENSLVDPVFGRSQKENDKLGETKSQSPSSE